MAAPARMNHRRGLRKFSFNHLLTTVRGWPIVRRITSLPRRFLAAPIVLWCIIGLYLIVADLLYDPTPNRPPPVRMKVALPVQPLETRVDCKGVRGKFLSESKDDMLKPVNLSKLDVPYTTPFIGSHADLGIELTYMTVDGRYGPYGYGEEQLSYSRTRVNWDTVDWGKLQDECFELNAHRFPENAPRNAHQIAQSPRFSFLDKTTIPPAPTWDEFRDTRRTALVVRSFEGFEYTPDVMWFMRSLITEAALRTGGEYAVVLLLNVQDEGRNIFKSQEDYDDAFEDMNIPPELRSISILWDDHLLQSWYEKVPEHR